MYLGRVVGRVWSTVKDSRLDGQRLLIVQPVSPECNPTGKRLVCADWTGAGSGDLVYWVRGKEAAMAFLPDEVPTDLTIVGIVDSIHLKPTAPGGAFMLIARVVGDLTIVGIVDSIHLKPTAPGEPSC